MYEFLTIIFKQKVNPYYFKTTLIHLIISYYFKCWLSINSFKCILKIKFGVPKLIINIITNLNKIIYKYLRDFEVIQ